MSFTTLPYQPSLSKEALHAMIRSSLQTLETSTDEYTVYRTLQPRELSPIWLIGIIKEIMLDQDKFGIPINLSAYVGLQHVSELYLMTIFQGMNAKFKHLSKGDSCTDKFGH
jgi:hypothetical protein